MLKATGQEGVQPVAASDPSERASVATAVETEETLSPAGAAINPSGRTLISEVDRRPALRAR